jgi:hypothetical protein
VFVQDTLTVTRLDAPGSGWGMNPIAKCCTASSAIGSQPLKKDSARILYLAGTNSIFGIASDGDAIYINHNAQEIRTFGFDGASVSAHAVPNLPQGQNSQMVFAKGAIYVRNGAQLYRISTSSWTSELVNVDASKPMLTSAAWVTGSLLNLPDGRIGTMGPLVNGQFFIRLYVISTDGLSLAWQQDVPVNDTWSTDEHGTASDGKYLVRISFQQGYMCYDLNAGTVAYDGRGWNLRAVDKSGAMTNPQLIAFDPKGGRYLVGDQALSQILISATVFVSSGVTFSVAAADRVAGKSGVQATFSFTPSVGGAGPTSITLNYPSGFFATSPTPSASVSSAGTAVTPGPPGATSIVLAVNGTALAAGAAVTVTLAGCTLGAARAPSDSVTLQTSADQLVSSPPASCGAIGGAVTLLSFSVAAADRVAGKSGVQATFSFTPSVGGAGPTSITLNYPSGFFATSPTPSASVSSAGTAVTPGPPGATSIVLAVNGTALAAGAAVTVTLAGCTLGANGTIGGSVECSTSVDVILSFSAPSGFLMCSSPPGRYCPNAFDGSYECRWGYYCPFSNMKDGILCEAGTYCVAGSSAFTSCPAGSFNPFRGMRELADCLPCVRGRYNPLVGQAECSCCLPGEFANVTGLSHCFKCSASDSCDQPCTATPSCTCYNAARCDGNLCPPGCYSHTKASPCTRVPAGSYSRCLAPSDTYCSSSGNMVENCPKGTSSLTLGATDNSTCLVCPAGTYCPNKGMAVPSLCDPGSYSSSQAAVSCTQCVAGTFALGFGSSACDGCSAGMFCPSGASQQCRCPLNSYQDGDRSSACKPCTGQAILATGLNVCATDSAEEESFKGIWFSVIGVFATISFCYFVLSALLWRSRHLAAFGTAHTRVCIYTASVAVYALLKVCVSHIMLQAQTQPEKLAAGMVMSCSFMVFFCLVAACKMAIAQSWTHIVSDLTSANSQQSLLLSAHRARMMTRRIALAVCAAYCVGFASLAGVFSQASGACATYTDTAICIPFSSSDVPPACDRAVSLANRIFLYEGVFTTVFVVVFSFYSILFSSIVFPTPTSDISNSNVAKLQRLLIANTLARWIMKPYAPHFCVMFTPSLLNYTAAGLSPHHGSRRRTWLKTQTTRTPRCCTHWAPG